MSALPSDGVVTMTSCRGSLDSISGCASANPMKVQNVFFITLGTYALDFRLVAVGVHLEIVVVLFCLLMLHRRVSFIRWHIQNPLSTKPH